MARESDYIATDGGLYPRGFSVKTEWRWPLVKSSEIVKLNYGKAMRATDRIHGSVPVYGSNGQCGWHNESLRSGPGVILGRKGQGPLGVKWCDDDFWVIDTAYFATPETDELDLRYFYYLAKYIGLNHLKDGTSNPSLSRDTFADLLVPFPPIETQRAIVSIVKALDDKIELNRRMNATLESLARAIFKSWFVDFDPVRWQADGGHQQAEKNLSRFPLPPATLKLFPSTFQDSELGKIPSGWKVENVGEVVESVGGGTPSTKKAEFWEGGTLHWATPKDLSGLSSPIILDTGRKITEAGANKISSGMLPAGTLLLSSRAPVGYLAVAQMPIAINQGFIAMKPNDRASNYYMLNWCRENMWVIENRASGTTFQEISKSNFRPIPMLLPTKELVRAFTDRVDPLYLQIVTNLRESLTLSSLRDTLLPKLLSGELPVPPALTATEDALQG